MRHVAGLVVVDLLVVDFDELRFANLKAWRGKAPKRRPCSKFILSAKSDIRSRAIEGDHPFIGGMAVFAPVRGSVGEVKAGVCCG